MNIYVLMAVATPMFVSVPVCDFVEEMFGLLSPLPVHCCIADQFGRREVQDASGSQGRELGHTDIFPSIFRVILSVDGVIAKELVNGVPELTLCREEQKDRCEFIRSEHVMSLCSRNSSGNTHMIRLLFWREVHV